MKLLTTKGWKDYELLDSGGGRRLERFGDYTLSRPDPQCIWQPKLPLKEWERADGVFEKGWKTKRKFPESWKISYENLVFNAYLTPFKHTGIFPEQHLQWDWMKNIIQNSELKTENKEIKVLNLFGYTGGATLACAATGATVTHVDASRKSIQYAKENQYSSNLQECTIRWILDDAMTFVRREKRRGNTYHGIIMDPPIFGHGPNGSTWDFQRDFPILAKECGDIFDKDGLFFVVNAYAISASSIMLENVLADFLPNGTLESGELLLEEKSGRLLSTGIFARWER
jgi:23S rRNA (cytosine1962-C5)-methyltransferase